MVALAVMVTLPAFLPVTRPFPSTVATSSSELDHVTVLSVASSGLTVALRVSVPLTSMVCSPEGSRVTSVTLMGREKVFDLDSKITDARLSLQAGRTPS